MLFVVFYCGCLHRSWFLHSIVTVLFLVSFAFCFGLEGTSTAAKSFACPRLSFCYSHVSRFIVVVVIIVVVVAFCFLFVGAVC